MRVLLSRASLTVFVFALLPSAFCTEDAVDTAKNSAAEWVSLRVETARLETQWREERALVESMAAALEERARAVEEKRDLVKAQTIRDREELDRLRARIEAGAADVQTFDAGLRVLTERLVTLRPGLPPRLSDALEMSYRSLRDDGLGASERMHLVMTLINRCTQFNRTVTIGEDVVSLEGEAAPKALEVIYWGLSHGYAIDPTTRRAWLGAPVSGVWRWEPQAGAYDAVADLMRIARDKADPRLIAVPAFVPRLVDRQKGAGTP